MSDVFKTVIIVAVAFCVLAGIATLGDYLRDAAKVELATARCEK